MSNETNPLLAELLSNSHFSSSRRKRNRLINRWAKNDVVQHHINALIIELLNADKRTMKQSKNAKPLKCLVKKALPTLILKIRLPNIRANTDFNEKLVGLENYEASLRHFQDIDFKELSGITFNSKTLSLGGNFESIGDHELELNAVNLLPDGQMQNVLIKIKVTCIPDPRSLWKDIPSDSSARFHKPDNFHSYQENNTVLQMASSVRGRSHAHKGIHRDDDFQIFCNETSEWNISCVTDGAGSCKYSRQGAYIAASVATKKLKETLNGHYGNELEALHDRKNDEEFKDRYWKAIQETIFKAAQEANRAIRDSVDTEKGDTLKDFSTTLLLAAHKKIEGGHLVISFWVGDGGIVIYDKNKKAILLGEPDAGEFAGQTRFLESKIFNDSSVYNRIVLKKVESMTALILASDGITDAWFDTEKHLETIERWDNVWKEVLPALKDSNRDKGLEHLTDWMGFWSKGNHDDRTIAITMIKE